MLSWLFSELLPVGSQAPDFAIPAQDGKIVQLSSLKGKNVVLVFYPGDDTLVCRAQLCEFRDQWSELKQQNVLVLGINPQSSYSHQQFREKYSFPFPLLVDTDQKVAELYHADGWMVKRSVYLIGPDRTILYARRGKPDPAEVLSAAAPAEKGSAPRRKSA